MFKQLSILLIISTLLLQHFNKLLIIADYYTNTASFVKNCINKAKPKLRCKGKCQMMKQLQEEEKKEQQNTGSKIAKNEIISSRSFYATVPAASFTQIRTAYVIINEGNTIAMPHNFFHPPDLI